MSVHALREIDLDIRVGELLVLLGASGSGKSTLLNILGGLDVATSGTVTYRDLRLDQLDADGLTEYRRAHVGVAIARAVAKRPDVLFCDEPTGALDAQTGKLVLRVLDQVNRETGTTLAIITHNAAIGGMGDTVLRMSSGEIVERKRNAQRASVDDIEW